MSASNRPRYSRNPNSIKLPPISSKIKQPSSRFPAIVPHLPSIHGSYRFRSQESLGKLCQFNLGSAMTTTLYGTTDLRVKDPQVAQRFRPKNCYPAYGVKCYQECPAYDRKTKYNNSDNVANVLYGYTQPHSTERNIITRQEQAIVPGILEDERDHFPRKYARKGQAVAPCMEGHRNNVKNNINPGTATDTTNYTDSRSNPTEHFGGCRYTSHDGEDWIQPVYKHGNETMNPYPVLPGIPCSSSSKIDSNQTTQNPSMTRHRRLRSTGILPGL